MDFQSIVAAGNRPYPEFMQNADMNCSWCSKKIGFIRSLTDTEYCSAAHRKEEEQTLRRLAIERLRQPVAFERSPVNA